jgi:hypothetical protein
MVSLSVAESDLDRFLNEAEECLRQADMATNPADKKAWVHLAEDWMKLARAAREREA